MLSPLEKILLALLIFILMVGMGSTLTWDDFKKVLKAPKGIIIGFLSQFGFMPLIALGLAHGLSLPAAAALGLILVGCTPGGTTSNMFTYFSRGDLALSISMTVASTFTAVIMMPLLIWIYASGYAHGLKFIIPYKNIAGTLIIVIIPVLIGMFIRKRSLRVATIVEKIGSAMGILVIIFLIVTWVQRNHQMLSITSWQHFASAACLGLAGFAIGYGFSIITGLDPKQRRTISLETGIQNTPLTFAIILLTFPAKSHDEMLFLPILYAIGIVLTSSFVTILFRAINRREAQPVQ